MAGILAAPRRPIPQADGASSAQPNGGDPLRSQKVTRLVILCDTKSCSNVVSSGLIGSLPPPLGGVLGSTLGSTTVWRGSACQTAKVEMCILAGIPPPTTTSAAPSGHQHQALISPRSGTKLLQITRLDEPALSLGVIRDCLYELFELLSPFQQRTAIAFIDLLLGRAAKNKCGINAPCSIYLE